MTETETQSRITAERRDTVLAEQDLFWQPDVRRVRIMGINALGLLHRHASDLLAVLLNGGAVQVLLVDPQSAEFRRRRDAEEKRRGRVSNRLQTEMEASIAILRDILNLLLHEHDRDIGTLADQFQTRLYDLRADKSFLIVETPGRQTLLYRKLPLVHHVLESPSKSILVTSESAGGHAAFAKRIKVFHDVWRDAKVVSLQDFRSEIVIVSPRKSDLPHIYAQAMELHRKRRLDEASALYKTVLRVEKPKMPTDEQVSLARRFVPRVCTTRREPFALKDLVVVIHPDKAERLVSYHLIWEDDIDYLADNDPSDHEIVWIKYSRDMRVEAAWSYWHRAMLSTSKAVPDANANDFRVKVHVQWGKHGSLLEGWEEKIGVRAPHPGHPDLETVQFERLSNNRRAAEGHYAARWPQRFEGSLDEFLEFPVEVDVEKKLDDEEMIVVSRFANAVISELSLPYNIRPKVDWPIGGPSGSRQR